MILVLPSQVRSASLSDSVANRLHIAITTVNAHIASYVFTKFVNANASHNYFVISNHHQCKYKLNSS